MVLGIIGLIYSLIFSIISVGEIMESNRLSAYSVYDYYYYLENDPAEIYIPALIIIAVMPLLALIFGVVSKKRGYRCGVSTAGVSTGIIGLAAVTIALIFAFASM